MFNFIPVDVYFSRYLNALKNDCFACLYKNNAGQRRDKKGYHEKLQGLLVKTGRNPDINILRKIKFNNMH